MRGRLVLLLVATLAACGAPERKEATNAVVDNEVAAEAGTNAANEAAPEPVVAQALPDHLGPIKIGATLAALKRDGVTVAGQDEPMEGSTCTYANFKGMPDVAAMLDSNKIARIDVSSAAYETLGGVRVGQSEAEAVKRLGGRAKVEPHPYTGPEGHYLTLHEKGAPTGLIIETDGKTVQSYRFGRWEQVQWIEGCS